MRTWLNIFQVRSVVSVFGFDDDRPVAVTYELTEFGASALGILDDLRNWSETHDIA